MPNLLRLDRRFSYLPFSFAISSLVAIACGTSSNNDATAEQSPDSGLNDVDTGTSPPNEDDAAASVSDATVDATTLTQCTKAAECPSNVCDLSTGKCLDATCKDGTRNQDETDVDCGGAICGKCDIQKKCDIAEDCASGVCLLQSGTRKCQQPACDDGVKNGNETGIDCGGTCGKCDDNTACNVAADCKSDVCSGGKCLTPSCNDGTKNGTDTDIDCGGPSCPRCADTKMCTVSSDCQSGVCTGGTCQVPVDSDGVKNGTETDTDCGGAGNKTCDVGKHCTQSNDCSSTSCNYNQTCVSRPSCTGHYGGDTCGFGGAGSVGPEQWEDCCATAPVTVAGKTVQLGKYEVTAGRMRTFMESVGYNVRGFVQSKRDVAKTMPKLPNNAARYVLEPAWDMYLPTSFDGNGNADEVSGCAQRDWNQTGYANQCLPGSSTPGIYTAVSRHLGGFIFNRNSQTSTGCYPNSPGTHAFRFADGVVEIPGAVPEHSQEVYDTKAMNCIDYLVAEAFCVWDGGRLESLDEWKAAIGTGTYPWSATSSAQPKQQAGNSYAGCRFPTATDGSHPACGNPWLWSDPLSIEYASYKYSYEYPNLVATDYIVFISAPGRTRGRGAGGHADLLGNGFEITSTVSYNDNPLSAAHQWSGNGSWEGHAYNKNGNGTTMLLNKYGKLGLRCAYP